MYKLLIVEDEEYTRQGLKQLPFWTEFGIDEIVTANNGLQGLEAVRIFQPDILITDVKMPVMDGVALSNAVHEDFPKTKIIFLSGYDDKQFLKNAIKVSACDYILKPVDHAALRTCVANVVRKLDTERSVETLMHGICRQNSHQRQLLQETILHALITGDPAEARRLYAGIQDAEGISQDSEFRVLAFCPEQNRPEWQQAFMDILQSKNIQAYFAQMLGYTVPVCVLQSKDNPEEFLKSCVQTLKSRAGFRCAFALSPAFCSIWEIKEVLTKTIGAFETWFAGEEDGVVLCDAQFSKECSVVPFPSHTNWNVVFKLSREAFVAYKERMYESIRAARPESRENTLIFLTEELRTAFGELHDVASKAGDEWSVESCIGEIASHFRRKPMLEEADRQFTMIYELINRSSAQEIRQCVEQAMAYIEDRYYEKLTIADIAKAVYRAPTYLCIIFRETTGYTINAYITHVRIGKAKELLGHMDLKLGEISQMVGYTNPGYFAAQFKKITGMMPSKFRECKR